ncbi:MAG: Rieske (2Fe-2S) protein [Myxococcaceae bacterium]|nr:Rieske (2Fe-2S) protein [Myxococcaceae bacterium]
MATATTPSDRRGVLKLLAGFLGAGMAALATVPVVGSVLTPLLRKTPSAGGFIDVLAEKELVADVPHRVELSSTQIDAWNTSTAVLGAAWVLKKKDGSLTALSTVCPHSGCSISQKTKDTYGCPCHASTFSLDGTATEGPSPRPMDPLTVQVKDGRVLVKHARFRIGTKEREEI